MPVQRRRGAYHAEAIAEPEGWDRDAAEEAAYRSAEEDRLLYVAATRARNLLVVSRYAPKSDDGPWSALAPMLDDVPELPHDEAVSERRGHEGPMPDLTQRRLDRAARFEQVRRPSFLQVGRGPWFTAATRTLDDRKALLRHVLLAAVQERLPDEEASYVRHLVGMSDTLHASDEGAALEAIKRFRASALWADVRRADTVYTEVPFTLSEHVTGSKRIVQDQVEIVYCKANEWHLVVFEMPTSPTVAKSAAPTRRDALIDAFVARCEAAGRHITSQSAWHMQTGRLARR
jgi:ATP-dependent helicase/nuclease subunit A